MIKKDSKGSALSGVVFDIQEFAVNDGPGIRVTVFLKGCPLRCKWCHNPEGMNAEPQANAATGRMVGREWSVEALVGKLVGFKDVFDLSGGGVTFSGGEATAQGEFLIEVAKALRERGVHVNLDTCGQCSTELFRRVLENVDLVYYDLKCMDSALHKQMTGVGNELILANARVLAESGVKYHVRVPSVPGVGATEANRRATEAFVAELPRPPESIDWLPFNEMAGAKYANFGMKYEYLI